MGMQFLQSQSSMLTKQQLEQYHQDGVVCLRRIFDAEWIQTALAGIDRNLHNPGNFFRDHTADGSAGKYVFDFWNWREIPEFEQLVFSTPLGALGADLLGANRVRLLMDNWFRREAGAINGAPWHHDEPYFDFEGRMCIIWIPLEGLSARDGLTFIKGSHRWGKLYVAEQFSENVPFDCYGDGYHPLPDFDADPNRYDFLSWDLEPGDCLAFDFRAIHSATEQRQSSRTTHRVTFRMGGEDVVFRPRGEWTREISAHLISLGQEPGSPLDNPLTPIIFEP